METKLCSCSPVPKPITDFYFRNKSKGLRHSYCKECNKANGKRNYNKDNVMANNRVRKTKLLLYIKEAKNKPCVDCGIEYPPYVMDFDHLRDKEFNIAQAADKRVSLENLQKEIDKCEVVCANCHRVRTYGKRTGLDKSKMIL